MTNSTPPSTASPSARGHKRRVIQVAVDETSVVALCDDGTLWALPERGDSKWRRLPPIPQEE